MFPQGISQECLDHIKLYNGMHRFLPTLFKMEGFTVTENCCKPLSPEIREIKVWDIKQGIQGICRFVGCSVDEKRKLNYEVENE